MTTLKLSMDTLRHKGLRNRLVQEIANKGISNPKVLQAIGNVPRHMFFESSFIKFAYQDKAFPLELVKQFLNHLPLHFKLNY